MDFLNLDPLILAALREDLGRGDVTTGAILADAAHEGWESRQASAEIVAKQDLALAGWPVFLRVFQLLGEVRDERLFPEGAWAPPGTLGRLRGHPGLLLKGERTALNLLQRMCGVATATRRLVDKIAHTGAQVLDTRKTTPLWRAIEKYAVRMGGGRNHRMGLDDAVLIKENHIAVAGGVRQAIQSCRRRASHLKKIEIEVRDAGQLEEAIAAGADVVMLDNMSPAQVREAVAIARGRCLLEVSGGVDEENIVDFAETGVDFISVGALTHSYAAADVSMLIQI